MNVLAFVGKVSEVPLLKESSMGNKFATMLIEVTRNFANNNGTYDIDKFTVTLWKGIAETATAACQTGDMIAVKGRLQSHDYEGKDGVMYRSYDIIAEQITLLSPDM